jgi:zinc and cadmium transporter
MESSSDFFVFHPNLMAGLMAVIVVSLISFVGAYVFFLSKEKSSKIIPYLVSLAIGALLGDSLLHLLPEAYADSASFGLFAISLLAGFGIFYALEHALHWHHSHDGDEEHHDHGQHVGGMITAADGLHNFIDGIIIGLGFLISVEVGIATTLAVILHEIPQEISDMGLLMYAGWAKGRALVVNFLSGCTAILGFLLVFLLDARAYGDVINSALPYLLSVAGGGFLYIAIIDLIPDLKAKNIDQKGAFWGHMPMMVLGFAVMVVLKVFE